VSNVEPLWTSYHIERATFVGNEWPSRSTRWIGIPKGIQALSGGDVAYMFGAATFTIVNQNMPSQWCGQIMSMVFFKGHGDY
jgi:hypothetical protein